jgi:hypothetical protein
MLGAIIIIVIAVLLTKLIIYLSENSLDNHIDKSQNEKERLEQLNKRVQSDICSINIEETREGEAEERYIESELQRQNFPKRVLRDMYIPYNGETKQIDVLLLTQFGIYVIESKDYSGWIFGSLNSKIWTQSLNKNNRYKFYNPIWQNNSHIKALCTYLHSKCEYFNLEDDDFYSLIIFSGKAELKKIPQNLVDCKVINDYELNDYINYENMNKPQIFTEEQLDKFYNILLPTTQVSDEVKQKHIENVKKYQIKNS